jgi:hypothetical protein
VPDRNGLNIMTRYPFPPERHFLRPAGSDDEEEEREFPSFLAFSDDDSDLPAFLHSSQRAAPPRPGSALSSPFDLLIAASLQFLRPMEIASLERRSSRDPVESIGGRIRDFLYSPGLAASVLAAGPGGIRSRRRRPPLGQFEKLLMICFKHHFQEIPGQHFLGFYRELFHGAHRPEELFQHYQTILGLSLAEERELLREIAERFSEMEERSDPDRFPVGALTRAGVTREDLEWRDATRMRVPAPPLRLAWPDAAPYEALLDWIVGDDAFPENALAMLSASQQDFPIIKKLTTIGVGPTMEIPVDGLPGFAPREGRSYRVLLMLKNDLAFYVENIGDAAVRVNGASIRPTQAVCIRDYAVLQLGSVGMLFRINRRLITSVSSQMRLAAAGRDSK